MKVLLNEFLFCVVGILKSMAGKRQDDAVDVEMQCDMLIILSALCEGDMHRKVRTQGASNYIVFLYIYIRSRKSIQIFEIDLASPLLDPCGSQTENLGRAHPLYH